ncbi:MAG TPA: JAB domain-containing protein [Chryseosolibacter sp.]
MESLKNTLFQVAEVELSYRAKVNPTLRPKVTCAQEASDVFRQCWDDSKIDFIEQFHVLLLNRAKHVLGIYRASTGTTAGCAVDARSVFIAALKANASAVILAHNHPSGNLTPSKADTDLTRRLSDAGKIIDIEVVDHIILTRDGYYSFAEQGAI